MSAFVLFGSSNLGKSGKLQMNRIPNFNAQAIKKSVDDFAETFDLKSTLDSGDSQGFFRKNVDILIMLLVLFFVLSSYFDNLVNAAIGTTVSPWVLLASKTAIIICVYLICSRLLR